MTDNASAGALYRLHRDRRLIIRCRRKRVILRRPLKKPSRYAATFNMPM
ncbi:hypothetical protein KCP69_22415 [Salmonella enterica subsp. enterica]|nr:hypothetical protein KCP69_22415 [Salmonella enterica subsp. enterica]